jgi:hypothetical protein
MVVVIGRCGICSFELPKGDSVIVGMCEQLLDELLSATSSHLAGDDSFQLILRLLTQSHSG